MADLGDGDMCMAWLSWRLPCGLSRWRITGRGLDGGGGVVAGVVAGAGEAADVAAVADRVGGRDRSHTVSSVNVVAVAVTASPMRSRWAAFPVEAADLGEQLPGKHLAFDPDRRRRADPGEDGGCPFGL